MANRSASADREQIARQRRGRQPDQAGPVPDATEADSEFSGGEACGPEISGAPASRAAGPGGGAGPAGPLPAGHDQEAAAASADARHAPGHARPPGGARRALSRVFRRRRLVRRAVLLLPRPVRYILAAALTASVLVVGWSVGHALTEPGGGTFSQRIAEWARDHYLGPLVTLGEWITYHPPKVGGAPAFALTGPGMVQAQHAAGVRAAGRGHGSHRTAGQPPASQFIPPRVPSPAGKPLPGEGIWRVDGTVHGEPAVLSTFLRPDKVHTSYVAGIVSMNQQVLRFQLRPGVEDPGPGRWRVPADVPPGSRTGLMATFNNGFKIASSGGGFYLNGVTRGRLTQGAASMVFYRNGQLKIGIWGRTVRKTPGVVGVRQNLRLIVQNGKVPATVDQNVLTSWGATLGGGYYVWRSGVGITSDGRIIFVYGPALDVRSLADLLKRAGAVSAMQLDINPDWMSFMYYRPGGHPANPTPKNLLPTQLEPPTRYYSLANRDFTAVFSR
ncbi:MAG TPA: phosphodiester glycosidase family protein [Streptosporangiaceae bacterium]